MSFKIKVLTCFVATDSNGEEGLMAFRDLTQPGRPWMPMVCADQQRLEIMYAAAQVYFKDTDYRIVQFSVRQDITELTHEKFSDEPNNGD